MKPTFLGYVAGALLLSAGPADAIDGLVEINQAAAIQGGITPGDSPGFPVTISVAGSYRLTGDLTTASKSTAVIEISHERVWLDLNGFSIGHCLEPTFCTFGNARAIDANGITDVSIQGGRVVGSDGACIYTSQRALLQDLQVEDCETGIKVGSDSRVTDVTVSNSENMGVIAGEGTLMKNLIVEGSGSWGVTVGWSALLVDSVIRDNGGAVNATGGAAWVRGGYRGCLIVENDGTNEVQPINGALVNMGLNVCGTDTICP